ncbi:hypothetical protein FEM48_Zijuj11G0158200 [Ziziphus jujuba var. spinosa]|uniref:Uncharacterized protein n=1 Tax=Ziziphus jujuba var. spinosa TaxID=714518 RepID=A0A978UJV0_ZIZJJ|nr:uncharacterized protein LOC107431109 isoform X2 [Ziziphus jujuba var. spinosa]KAH7515081.1 hypothetical protein FEM48_Zijuj11G0158200 [Ziziphus jujuba var. spinosa]
MALVSEFMMTMIILITRPFTLFKLACLFCMKTVFVFIHTWIELVRATINFHLNLVWRSIMWTVALVSLPLRILTAIQRERQLELHLHDMQIESENLAWDRKQLQEHLQTAIKEHKMMELILAELEEEHDKAIAKIELLEGELQDLKTETLRLREVQGKQYWSFRGQGDTDNDQNTEFSDKYGIPYGISSWKPGYSGSGVVLQDLNLLMQSHTWGDESTTKAELLKLLKSGSKSSAPIHPVPAEIISRNSDMNKVLDQRRGIAIKQSLFSAVLSLLVGMIIWEAEDPCMPLVVALFTVVGMSLKSVVQFFSTIKNKPASDAVALLSFNWFILGTLTYPTLPRVARMLTPLAVSFLHRAVSCLGLSFLF